MAFPWMAAATLGSAGIGALSSMFGDDSGGSSAGVGQLPYQVITQPTYTHQEPVLGSAADFTQKGLENLTAGKLPEWWNKFQQPVRRGLLRGVEETFMGGAGLGAGQGVLDLMRSAGAATGTGPKSTMSYVAKGLKSYMDKRQQVEEYMAGKSLEFGKSQSEKLPWMAAQIGSISPPSSVVGGGTYSMPAQENPWASGIEGLMGAIPYLVGGGEDTAASAPAAGGPEWLSGSGMDMSGEWLSGSGMTRPIYSSYA